MRTLESGQNAFLTGGAGTGKSFLVQRFLNSTSDKGVVVTASTGAAAIIVGGRTFHSFFGLGLLEGGPVATVARALKNKRVTSRMRKAKLLIVDEISMVSGAVLDVAEEIARKARKSSEPWGGLRVIFIGDFTQLPPVDIHNLRKDWAFLSRSWAASALISPWLSPMKFQPTLLYINDYVILYLYI